MNVLLRRFQQIAIAMSVGIVAAGAGAQSLAPDITVTKIINAPVAEVWRAWTTAEGIESFFAPKAAKVDPVPGGAFQLWFGVNNPERSPASQRSLLPTANPM